MKTQRLKPAAGLTLAFALAPFAEPAAAKETFATFEPPGSTYTYAAAINASGVVAGFYEDSNNIAHGFIRAADGTITSVDVPGASATEVEASTMTDRLPAGISKAVSNIASCVPPTGLSPPSTLQTAQRCLSWLCESLEWSGHIF